MKIAIVHDSFVQYGGAERVVEAWKEMFPEAPVYTLVYDKEKYPKDISSWQVRTSFLQGLYKYNRNFKHFLALLPFANKAFNFSGYDVVLSSSSLFLKGLEVPKGTVHINYCHTPVRFLWTEDEYINQEVPSSLRWLVRGMVPWLKSADKEFARRPQVIIANSKEVQKRIKEFYGRDSEIVYPFVDTEFWRPSHSGVMPGPDPASRVKDWIPDSFSDALKASGMTQKGNYFLIGGRLQAHKDNESIIKLFNELNLPLHVVGTGGQEQYLNSIANKNIVFLGRVSDEVLRDEYSGARGFLYPQFEDFGQMPLEAAACGTASIGLNRGGSLETIVSGITGELFDGTIESLRKVILSWDEHKYRLADLRLQAEKFSKETFKQKVTQVMLHK